MDRCQRLAEKFVRDYLWMLDNWLPRQTSPAEFQAIVAKVLEALPRKAREEGSAMSKEPESAAKWCCEGNGHGQHADECRYSERNFQPVSGMPQGAAPTEITVIDYATGAKGSYCLQRMDGIYASFWNPSGWAGSGYVFTDKRLADSLCKTLNDETSLRGELEAARQALPDSLNRPLPERIAGLMERANREASLACELRAANTRLKEALQRIFDLEFTTFRDPVAYVRTVDKIAEAVLHSKAPQETK